MDAKGAVLCFQKYIWGCAQSTASPGGPVCLGYMGRVDVRKVHRFKDFVSIASQHGANYACTRKQLLIYQIDESFDRSIDVVEFDGSPAYPNDGRIPFCSMPTGDFFGLGCCSVLNVSRELQDQTSREIASLLHDGLEKAQVDIRKSGMNLEFAITGLLGGEDLCLIFLSDQFSAISRALSAVQQVTYTKGSRTITVADNTHSILMVDSSGRSCNWGAAHAEIFLSAKSKSGISYLAGVYNRLREASPDRQKEISFEGCHGEYDAVIRCPAALLNSNLYCGPDGPLSYDNPAYQNAVYQSETFIYPFGGEHSQAVVAEDFSPPPCGDLGEDIEQVMSQITQNILGTEEDKYQELIYIRLTLYRLVKDYRRMLADPFNSRLHCDLTVQFHAAVHAIIHASEPCRTGDTSKNVQIFNGQFDQIVNALNNTMQVVGQVDRFRFDEQPSYLQNTGSYHKILLAYYGFIKDVLSLFYRTKKDASTHQPILVPLLSFGLTPIVNSQSFSTSYTRKDGKPQPAKLLCIKLPYQALANPPKYLGILVHEIFHYLNPPLTDSWNRLLAACLARLSICEFIGVLATGISEDSSKQNYGSVFQHTYAGVIRSAAKQMTDEIFACNPELDHADPESLRKALFQIFDFHRDAKTNSYQFYRQLWENLRCQFEAVQEDAVLKEVFALKKGESTKLHRLFSQRVQAVPDFYPFRNLLKSYYSALTEVVADLFDVGIVLYNQNRQTWARQFFWQIYSTRSDLLLGSERANTTPDHAASGLLSANGIRFGIIMDYCLGLSQDKSGRTDRFTDYLRAWCHNYKEKDRFELTQTTFRRDYQIYTEYEGLYTDCEKTFLDAVCAAQENLRAHPNCVKIMEKISGLYQRYYENLDRWHKGELEDADLHMAEFALCVEFIESYQRHIDIWDFADSDTAAFPTSHPAQPPICASLPKRDHPPRRYAEYPEDLSWAMSSACERMAVKGKIPILWFRGQRNKHTATLPTMLRTKADISPLTQFRQELHLARTQILPMGMDFTKAEWLAYLQHNGFSTNVLDFSESFYPALYFAIQRWIDSPEILPEYDSHITLLNPVLFNLAMCALDAEKGLFEEESVKEKHFNRLKCFLEQGTIEDGLYLQLPLFACDEEENAKTYRYYFSWNDAAASSDSPRRPRAAFLPKNSERMKRQSGQFVFYDLRSKMEFPMETLHKDYQDFAQQKGLPKTPFLYEININRFAYKSFISYVTAIGLRKYHVYPEHDKLAKDLQQLLNS